MERRYNRLSEDRQRRLSAVPSDVADGKVVAKGNAARLLGAVIQSGDRVVIEGDNQKQAAFLAKTLASLDPAHLHDLHMLMSSVVLDEHLEVFRRGIAKRLDFSFAGPQAVPLAALVADGVVSVGAIHTYLELYSRYFTDLTPRVALVCAEKADRAGNLYAGCNTEETSLLCEVTHAKHGTVVAEVEELCDALPRVDIPGDQVEFVIPTGEPNSIEPLFTRDPGRIGATNVLMGMLAIKGIYAEYGVQRLNHGIGYATAAIELLLPTYAERLGLKGKICSYWVLNPHPTLIPAIEAGFVESVYSFGSEPGMEAYIEARPDVFFTCHNRVLRSSRPYSHMAGHYAVDCFIGSTLQIDPDGNSSTATKGRISGFGGAPNLGCNAPGRRHSSGAWGKMAEEIAASGPNRMRRGRKLVVQITPTVVERKNIPVFVEELDAVQMAQMRMFEAPPVMIFGEDVTHIVTEKGIAYLCRCSGAEERRAAIRAIAGETPVGKGAKKSETETLRKRRVVAYPEDLGITKADATRDLLAAGSIADLARISGGLYRPPPRFEHAPA